MPLRRKPGQRRFRGRVAREGGAASLAGAWRAWLAENLLLGASREDLLARLSANGVPDRVALREIDELGRSPWMKGASRVARLLRRHELVARVKRESSNFATEPRIVERRSRLSGPEFFDRYYAANLPVVITDMLESWPAVSRWSPSHFKERFGDVEVEASSGRDDDPFFDPRSKAHRTRTRLGEFCDRIATATSLTNDFYLVANNGLTKRAGLAPLLEDVGAPNEYLDDRRTGDCVSLWLGPAGTVTSLHHDTANVLFCQAFGRKKVLLISPFELSLTRDIHHGVYSAVDAEQPDLEAFPQLAGASVKEVVLAPGETLFIPVSWWHQVRALDASVSVSFTNFRLPNRFDWYHPGSTE